MKRIPVSRLSNEALIQELDENVAQDCPHTARQVALIGEVERRRLYAPAGYPSMYQYCLGKLHLSEDAAYKRIRAARAGRRPPAVLAAMAEGRVHLTGIVLLKPHLTTENVEELLRAAAHKSKAEIELMLAERFPKADLQARVQVIPPTPPRVMQLPAVEPGVEPQPLRVWRANWFRNQLASLSLWGTSHGRGLSTPASRRWLRSAAASSSRWTRPDAISCNTCRTCSDTRCRAGISPRSSSAR